MAFTRSMIAKQQAKVVTIIAAACMLKGVLGCNSPFINKLRDEANAIVGSWGEVLKDDFMMMIEDALGEDQSESEDDD